MAPRYFHGTGGNRTPPGARASHRRSDILLTVHGAAVIARARKRAGLTQATLARRAGTSQPVISAYEHGRRDPTFGTLQRLIAATGEQLRLDAVPGMSDIEPPADPAAHARRLLDVLSLADAVPQRARSAARSARLAAPRMVSQ